ncbi:branched-chain amino acid transport system permease protein [Actinoplanes campanulatus]|uniref:Branched-chain amino acid transport system permease protein n=2 Tax=Actinoplanes TaxID=1865 RepID=A0A7W5FCT3_9ACTN|nr:MULTISPECIES: branched-chain amino acid ABC transporter permease [Actinoplanes]MBB3093612.1 branched-chain amino acid transport system permease protein [Actinoplanes campanulatus]MBO3737159.1 branched-chain amino acid ABC transporter permease [Actinoplanes flavus]GGN04503.1 branched-chain amino acid ABC transporter permease [Actinoplanes campanulatus]GID35313.1 branched-chain amino acid ABC transporter permease [Actinoplanes campanulatus]
MTTDTATSKYGIGGLRAKFGERWAGLPKWQRSLAFIAFVIFLYYLPYLGIPGLTWLRTDYIANGNNWAGVLFTCAVYVLIAIGLNVVIGLAGLLDLGYVGFFAVGAYSVALFGSTQSPVVKSLQAQFGLSEEWAVAWAICIPIALCLAMISGVLLGGPTLRLRGDYLAIVTLGFGEIIRIVVRNVEWSGGPAGIAAIPGPQGKPSPDNNVFGLIDAKPWYWLALTTVLLIVWLVRRLENSRVGRAWLAVREDEDAAAVMGVYPFKFKLWAFAIGAALGALSGLLYASRNGFIEPNQFNAQLSILFVAMVVVGGSGNMAGVALGAVLLAYLPERFREFSEWRFLVFGLALVLVMLIRPQGLIPSRRRARELKDRQEEVAVGV